MSVQRIARLVPLLLALLFAASPGLALADPSGAGPHNVVVANGQGSGRLVTRGQVQVNSIHAPIVQPVNQALAYGSCDGCVTLAVALQLDLYNGSATNVAPENVAAAVNNQCQGCVTVAIACQVARAIDDPSSMPPAERLLAEQMNRELVAIQSDPTISVDDAVAGVVGVIQQYEGMTGTQCLQLNRSSS